MSTINGRTTPPDRTIDMFHLSDLDYLDTLLDGFERLDFEACYCSVFDECWTTKMTTLVASEPVEACSHSEDPSRSRRPRPGAADKPDESSPAFGI